MNRSRIQWTARCLLWLVFLCLALPAGAAPGTANTGTNVWLESWLAAQAGLRTWSADAIQTRRIQTFVQPLVSTGKVWVVLPDRFRWELGRPPQTIAVRQPGDLFLIYPRLKRVEKYSLGGGQPGPWKDALALLEASFPKNHAELESRFQVLAVALTNNAVRLELLPRSSLARKFITSLEVGFFTNDFSPAWTELRTSDGSSLRNDFLHPVLNATLPDSLFEPKIESDWKVTEPAKGAP